MEERFVELGPFDSLGQADLAVAALAAHGIQASLEGVSAAWGAGEIRLQVRESDAALAKEVVSQVQQKEQIRCPNCGSEDVLRAGLQLSTKLLLGIGIAFLWQILIAVILFRTLLGLPIFGAVVDYECRSCGFKWLRNEER